MSDIPNLSGKVGLDVTDFKAGIAQLNREIRVVESGFKAAAAGMGDWGKSASGLEIRIKSLSSEIELQQKKVEAVRGEYERIRKEKGDNSRAAQELQIKLNKESETLGKLQTELGHTENSLKGLKNEAGKSNNVFKDFGSKMDKLGQQVPALGTAFSLLSNPLTLATVGIGAFIKYAENATKKTLEYNKQVMEMGLLTGLSAEETSRIIQVADDWEIEIGTVSKAMELMNKKGITPSIDNLAELADQYVIATDKSTFMEEASKKYGKSIGDLVPMLAKGGDALREQAASIDDNLIATDESIKSSRDFKVALDNLNDVFLGIAYTVGNDAIPILTDFLNLTKKIIDENKKDKGRWLPDILPELTAIKLGIEEWKWFIAWLHRGEKAEADLQSQEDKLNKARKSSITVTKDAVQVEEEAAQAEEKAAKELLLYNDAIDEYVKRSPLFLQQYAKFTQAQKDTTEAIDDSNDAFNDLKASIAGPIKKELGDFKKSQDELITKLGEVQTKIGKLNGMEYLTPDQQTELDDLKSEQTNLQTEYGNNAVAHADATKRILFDILTEKLAAADLTDTQRTKGQEMLEGLAKSWGLVDDNTAAAYTRAGEVISLLQSGDFAGAIALAESMDDAWLGIHNNVSGFAEILNNLPTHKQINVDVIYSEGMLPRSGVPLLPIPKAQGGIDYVTRPTLFLAGEAGDETVITIPGSRSFGKSLAAIQQIMIQAISGLGSKASATGGGMGGYGRQMQPSGSPISIVIQGTPSNELDMRRLARYVVDEVQRKQR